MFFMALPIREFVMIEAAVTLPIADAGVPVKHGLRVTGVAAFGLVWIAVVTLACVFGPALLHLNATLTDVSRAYAVPSSVHYLGTDGIGRDELARLLVGGRITLAVGVVAAIVAMGVGTVYGALAGFYGGWIDSVLMRIVDVFLAVPTIFLLIVLAAMFHGNLL
ncbi:MAG: hypothetical protein M3Y21_11810, partial [Candidatus Eremiobacteraeota bacterium]|nr:hypothetical protein [Candidatus Eremiobacteraeota bacterium]